MLKIFLCVLFFLNSCVVFLKNPLILGVVMLLISGCICFVVKFLISLWLALIFFLVYIGGILVLIFYSLILKSNPDLNNQAKSFYTFFFAFFLKVVWFFFLPFLDLQKKSWEVVGLELFNFKESFFMMGMLSFLLIVLWIISKLSYHLSGSFRPVY